MLEHVNLLPRQLRAPASLVWGVAGVAVLVVAVAVYAALLARDIRAQTVQQQALAQELDALRADIARRNRHDPAQLQAAVKALQQTVATYEPLVTVVRAGTLGSREGFEPLLATLARVDSPDVWLQQVGVSGEPRRLTITGRATSRPAALAYRTRLLPMLDPLTPANRLELQLEPAGTGPDGTPESYVFKLQ